MTDRSMSMKNASFYQFNYNLKPSSVEITLGSLINVYKTYISKKFLLDLSEPWEVRQARGGSGKNMLLGGHGY